MASSRSISQNRIFYSTLRRYGATLVIDLVCAKCGAVYHADLIHVGKWINCPRCGDLVPILPTGTLSTLKQETAVSQPMIQPKTSARTSRRFTHRALLFAAVSVVTLPVLAWLYSNQVVTDQSSGHAEVADRRSDIRGSAAENENPESKPKFEIVDGGSIRSKPSPEAEQHYAVAPRPSIYRSLATGTPTCSKSEYGGRGVLNVENGTAEDAEVRLSDSDTNQPIRCFFVKARDSVRIDEIPGRTYVFRYSAGLDWDDRELQFRWNPSYSEFEKEFVYTEVQLGDELEYHEISVTLHTVSDGNVRAKRISREQFLGTVRRASNP